MAIPDEDPFSVLGVDEGAERSKVESAFRRLALRCHPDRHPGDPLAKARFQRLNRAKETLLDPTRRCVAERRRCNQRAKPTKASKNPGYGQASRSQKRAQDDQAAAKRRCAAAAAAAVAAAKRARAAERLRQEETRAAARRAEEAATQEAKRRRYIEKQAEADAREKVAETEKHKADVLDAFLQKKRMGSSLSTKRHLAAPAAQAESSATNFRLVVERFAQEATVDRASTFLIEAPLDGKDRVAIFAHAEEYRLSARSELGGGIRLSMPLTRERSASNSPWEPPRCTRDDTKSRKRKHSRHASHSKPITPDDLVRSAPQERHRQALARLRSRRQNGDTSGLIANSFATTAGSWWVPDEEADRWIKYIDRCGF